MLNYQPRLLLSILHAIVVLVMEQITGSHKHTKMSLFSITVTVSLIRSTHLQHVLHCSIFTFLHSIMYCIRLMLMCGGAALLKPMIDVYFKYHESGCERPEFN